MSTSSDTVGDVDWSTSEPVAAVPSPVPPEPSPLDPSVAAERARAFVKGPKLDPIIPAPVPSVSTEIEFPIYDRAAGGYRIIKRLFGINELKTFVKLGMDQLVVLGQQEYPVQMQLTVPRGGASQRGVIPPSYTCRSNGYRHSLDAIPRDGNGRIEMTKSAMDLARREVNFISECIQSCSGTSRAATEGLDALNEVLNEHGHDFVWYDLSISSWAGRIPEWMMPEVEQMQAMPFSTYRYA